LSEPNIRDLVEEPLQFAEQGYRKASNQTRLGMVLTLRAVLISNQGEFAQAFALARQALTLLPEQDRQWRCRCLTMLGLEAILSGQLTSARPLLQQALAFGKIARWLPVMQTATTYLGEVCFSRGELQHAVGYFRQALALANEQQDLSQLQLTLETGARMIHYERLPLYSLAGLAYERNELEEAEHTLREALAQGQFVGSHILTPGLLLQVRLLYACGEGQQAREFLSKLATGWQRPEVHREIQMCQAWLALTMGDIATAQNWATTYERDAESVVLVRREEEGLLLARLRIAEGRAQEALDVLVPWRQQACAQERRHSELHLLVLEALARQALGARAQARETLLEAVTKARSEGYQRLFLDEGPAMEALLKSTLKEIQEQDLATYVRRLLYAFVQEQAHAPSSRGQDTSPLLEPLTPQEQRVLHLLAEGASNQQIATQLVISLVTVKKHVTNLLGKLGAANRTQAIVRAREYGLL
jgi:LuxR family maltose regulon positive regulatory protein